MNKTVMKMVLICAMLGVVVMTAEAESVKVADPNGILRKAIPDKLIVLTFDDGPASHATIVAPILKSFGFGGSFYVCDFDSFHTRKDWYMTWRQMKAMSDAGLEIGNHTVGHAGGAAIGPFLAMDDQLMANNVPRSTTIAWPVFQVNTSTYPHLAANGYLFGRGGHNRVYRPTVDNPFDIPCLYFYTPDDFIKAVRQATDGKIVVLCFHGIPDMEHPAVSLDPEIFKVMMQYLKDNNYTCIALRDLADYIDPVKAATLPPTANNYKVTSPPRLVEEIKPCAVPNVSNNKNNSPAKSALPSTAKNILSLSLSGPISGVLSGNQISLYVPLSIDVTTLAPTFIVSPLAKAVPPSGTVLDFSKPQTYTVTAQDGSSQVYTVMAIKATEAQVFTWNSAAKGNWSDASTWSTNLASASAPRPKGRQNYVFNFDKSGVYTVTNDLNDGFVLNQLNFGGSFVTVDGKSVAFSANNVTGAPAQINQNWQSGIVINNALY